MRALTVFISLLIFGVLLLSGGSRGATEVSGRTSFYDNFTSNSLGVNWAVDTAGYGNTVVEENGKVVFTTYGHRANDYRREHSFLKSKAITVENWYTVTLFGRWKFADPGTAEMWFRVYDPDTGKYIGVRYVSWTRTIAYDRPEGIITEVRNAPKEYTSFKLVLKKDGFEFWENGKLIKFISTEAMARTTRFQLVIGGWDDSPRKSHILFDEVGLSYEPRDSETPPVSKENSSKEGQTKGVCGPGAILLTVLSIKWMKRQNL